MSHSSASLHPATSSALHFLQGLGTEKRAEYLLSFRVMGGAGDAVGIKCFETLERYQKNEELEDRDVLALAWVIRDMEKS